MRGFGAPSGTTPPQLRDNGVRRSSDGRAGRNRCAGKGADDRPASRPTGECGSEVLTLRGRGRTLTVRIFLRTDDGGSRMVRIQEAPARRSARSARRLVAGALAVPLLAVGLAVVPGVPASAAADAARLPTANPANYSPNVLDGKVDSIWQVGNRVIIGGTFTQVANAAAERRDGLQPQLPGRLRRAHRRGRHGLQPGAQQLRHHRDPGRRRHVDLHRRGLQHHRRCQPAQGGAHSA